MPTLDQLPKGATAIVSKLLPQPELRPGEIDVARRLAELGFAAGEPVSVLHKGWFGDPIAVRVGDVTIALRRFEASLLSVEPGSVEILP